MNSKDGLALRYFGEKYADLCWKRQSTIDKLFLTVGSIENEDKRSKKRIKRRKKSDNRRRKT